MARPGFNLIQPHEFPPASNAISPQLQPPPSSIPIIEPHLFQSAPISLQSSSQPQPNPWRSVVKPAQSAYQLLCVHCRASKAAEQFSRSLLCTSHSTQICFKCLQQTSLTTCPECSRPFAYNEKAVLMTEVQGLHGNLT